MRPSGRRAASALALLWALSGASATAQPNVADLGDISGIVGLTGGYPGVLGLFIGFDVVQWLELGLSLSYAHAEDHHITGGMVFGADVRIEAVRWGPVSLFAGGSVGYQVGVIGECAEVDPPICDSGTAFVLGGIAGAALGNEHIELRAGGGVVARWWELSSATARHIDAEDGYYRVEPQWQVSVGLVF